MSVAHEVFVSVAHKMFVSVTHGVFVSVTHEVFVSVAHKMFVSVTHEVFVSVTHEVFVFVRRPSTRVVLSRSPRTCSRSTWCTRVRRRTQSCTAWTRTRWQRCTLSCDESQW